MSLHNNTVKDVLVLTSGINYLSRPSFHRLFRQHMNAPLQIRDFFFVLFSVWVVFFFFFKTNKHIYSTVKQLTHVFVDFFSENHRRSIVDSSLLLSLLLFIYFFISTSAPEGLSPPTIWLGSAWATPTGWWPITAQFQTLISESVPRTAVRPLALLLVHQEVGVKDRKHLWCLGKATFAFYSLFIFAADSWFSLTARQETFGKRFRMDPLVAAIDQGTSSTRFLVSDVIDDGDGSY